MLPRLLLLLLFVLFGGACPESPAPTAAGGAPAGPGAGHNRGTAAPEVEQPAPTTSPKERFDRHWPLGNADQALRAYGETPQTERAALPAAAGSLYRAWQLLHRQSYEEARNLVVAVVKSEPGLASAHTLLGRILYTEGRNQEAAAALEKAVAGGGAEPWYYLAQARRKLGQLQPARTAYLACRTADPRFNEAVVSFNLGLVLLETADYPAAAEEYERYHHLAPDDLDGLFQLGRAYLAARRYAECLVTFEAIADTDPTYQAHLVHYNRALAHLRLSSYQLALASFQEALKHDDFTTRPRIFSLMATCCEKQGKYQQAVDILSGALQAFPDHPELLDRLGWNLIHQGRRSEGVAMCRKAANLHFGPNPPARNPVPLRLPFNGTWKVAQGNDSNRTHFGLEQKYAYDFARVDGQGRYFKDDGDELWEHYTFEQEVLAPAAGVVIEAIDTQPDLRPSEQFDPTAKPNKVTIKLEPAGYIVITHLRFGSLKVAAGQRVARGQVLGLCGNSGYSTAPHIHIQFYVGDPSAGICAPFTFSNYRAGGRLVTEGMPREGELVTPAE